MPRARVAGGKLLHLRGAGQPFDERGSDHECPYPLWKLNSEREGDARAEVIADNMGAIDAGSIEQIADVRRHRAFVIARARR